VSSTTRSGRTSLFALVTAHAVSSLGSQVSMVAIPWLVLTTTGDPKQMGLVIAARTIPYLLSGMFGTPLADRFGIRRSVVAADAACTVSTAVIALVPHVGLPVIMAMMVVNGTVRGVGDRAGNVLLRPLVEAAGVRLSRMTAVHDGIGSAALLIGAPVGGLLIFWLGAQRAILVDSASYLMAVLIVAALVRAPAELLPKVGPAESYLVALRGGARFLRRDGLLMLMLTMTFLANMVNQAHGSLFVPLWVERVLNSPAALGTVFGAFAAGAVVGNLAFIALAPRLPRFLTFAICMAISGVPRVLVLALSHDLVLVLVVTFVSGVAQAAINPILGVLLYERVPAELQTRVFGLVTTVAFTGFPLGGLLGGWAVAGLGLTPALLLAAGVCLAATLAPLVGARGAERAASATGPASP
jgi:MFS family permease